MQTGIKSGKKEKTLVLSKDGTLSTNKRSIKKVETFDDWLEANLCIIQLLAADHGYL